MMGWASDKACRSAAEASLRTFGVDLHPAVWKPLVSLYLQRCADCGHASLHIESCQLWCQFGRFSAQHVCFVLQLLSLSAVAGTYAEACKG